MADPIKQQEVEKVITDLQNDFKIVGTHRVHSWYAWAIVGIVLGMAIGIIYVANRSGNFSASKASTNPAPQISQINQNGADLSSSAGAGEKKDEPTKTPSATAKMCYCEKRIPYTISCSNDSYVTSIQDEANPVSIGKNGDGSNPRVYGVTYEEKTSCSGGEPACQKYCAALSPNATPADLDKRIDGIVKNAANNAKAKQAVGKCSVASGDSESLDGDGTCK